MTLPFSPSRRAERLIATGRVVLASSSLLALWWDPSEPAKYASTAYSLLSAYLAYAVAVALLTWRATRTPPWQGLFAHCFDLAFFSAFIYFTAGPASPFIAYFVFALVCGTLRWQWRGTLWTAIASLAAFLGLGYYFAEVLHDPAFELNEFTIRGFYLAVVALLLGHLGHHEQRARAEMSLLAGWPQMPTSELSELLSRLLPYVARVHSAAGAAIVWAERSESGTHLAIEQGGKVLRRTLDVTVGSLVEPGLEDASFLIPESHRRRDGVLVLREATLARRGENPLAAELRELLPSGSLLSAPWHGELTVGRVLVHGLQRTVADDLLLAEVVAALAGARVESHLVLDRIREGAAAKERARLALDLHDGVLQSLTGVGLRLAAARKLALEDPERAESALGELPRLLAIEQRDLRFFIQDLEPRADRGGRFDLASRLAELIQRAESEWQIEIELSAEAIDEGLPEKTERDLYFLVRESLINSVRHGNARRIRIGLRRSDSGRIEVEVSDDGTGFSFSGRYEQEELARMGTGPRSLRERIASLGGRLVVESDEKGAKIEMHLPEGKPS